MQSARWHCACRATAEKQKLTVPICSHPVRHSVPRQVQVPEECPDILVKLMQTCWVCLPGLRNFALSLCVVIRHICPWLLLLDLPAKLCFPKLFLWKDLSQRLGHLKTLSLLANCLPQTTGGHTRQETALFWVGPWEILGDTRVALVQPSMLLCAKDSPDAGAGVKCTCISFFFFLFFPVCFSLRLLGFAQWSLWGWSTGRELKLEKACHFLSLMHFKQGMFINLTYFSHQARSKMHGASAL